MVDHNVMLVVSIDCRTYFVLQSAKRWTDHFNLFIGLYHKLHGVPRPVAMKKTVIKRRKRVPAVGARGDVNNAGLEGGDVSDNGGGDKADSTQVSAQKPKPRARAKKGTAAATRASKSTPVPQEVPTPVKDVDMESVAPGYATSSTSGQDLAENERAAQEREGVS